MSERELAAAIYAEITSPGSVEHALDVWRLSYQPGWAASDLVRHVLEVIAASAINAVLARRQSEAARTGRDPTNPFAPTEQFVQEWGDYEEEDGYPGSLVPKKHYPAPTPDRLALGWCPKCGVYNRTGQCVHGYGKPTGGTP